MSLQVEKMEKNMAKLTIEVAAEDLEKAMQNAYQKAKGRISIPGFRKGKAPRKMIEQMYGKGVFLEDAVNALIPEHYNKALAECELEIVSQPTIDITQAEPGKAFIFTAEVAVKPEVTLGEYKGVEVPKSETEVTDEDVEAELKKEQEKIENFQGRWANFEVIASAPNVQNMFKQLDEMVAQAPDKKETPQYVTAKWETPYQTERDKFNGQSDFYYDTKDKIGLSVRVDKGRNVDPVIRAVNYDTKAGSVTRFQYQEGTYIDERTIERLDAGSEEDPPEYKSWVEKLKNKISGEPEITEDEAQKKAEQVLKELDITGMKLQECVRAAGSTETESWGMLDEECETETGYSIYFYRTEGNLIGYETTYSDVYGDSSKIPETVYAPKFGTESIQMIITKNGIKKFRWNNISVKKEKIAGNTKLLPFNKIKEKLAQHILYMQISDDGEQTKKEGLKFTYEIRDVKLRLGNISAYEDPKSVWLVPVWVFEMDRSWEYKEQVNKESLPFEVTLNAIDGGYIEIE